MTAENQEPTPAWDWPEENTQADPARVESRPDKAQPTEVEQTPEPTPASPAQPDPWDTLTTPSDDEELSPSLRGIKLRDYLSQTKRALVNEKEANRNRNRAVEALEKALERNERLERDLHELRTPKPPEPDPLSALGVDPKADLWDNPDKVTRAIMEAAAAKAQGATQEQLAEMGRQISELRQSENVNKIRTAHGEARGQVDPKVWAACTNTMGSLIAAGQLRPDDPRSWQQVFPDAKRIVQEQFAPVFGGIPAPARPPQNVAPAPPVGTARSGGQAPATAAASAGADALRRLSPKQLAGIKLMKEVWDKSPAVREGRSQPKPLEEYAMAYLENREAEE